jgi:NADH-quinone oxidoreductase subunit A
MWLILRESPLWACFLVAMPLTQAGSRDEGTWYRNCLVIVYHPPQHAEGDIVIAAESTLLWPFLVYAVAVVGLVISMIALSAVLGQRHRDRATGDPYESGIISTGTARVRLSVQFYLVAMLFVIFDLEAVFIFAWAIGARTLGWPGYLGVVVFIMILTVALVYEWRQGALEWRTYSQVRSGNNRARQGVR